MSRAGLSPSTTLFQAGFEARSYSLAMQHILYVPTPHHSHSSRTEISGRLTHVQMLPFGGQGANQAIEDAGALGYLFQGVESPEEIPKRLELFEAVRRKRASRVQILSKVRVGKEHVVKQELLQYADPPGSGASLYVADSCGKC